MEIVDHQPVAYHPRPSAADDFAFIARRMRHMDVPADYDLGGAGPDAGYGGPIVDDVRDIGQKLRAIEASKHRPPPPAPPSPVAAEPVDDGWYCC